jgi:hypothetical protein
MQKNSSEILSAIWEYALKMRSPAQPYAEEVLKTPVLNGGELSACPRRPVQNAWTEVQFRLHICRASWSAHFEI